MAVNVEQKSWTPGTYKNFQENYKREYRAPEPKCGADRTENAVPNNVPNNEPVEPQENPAKKFGFGNLGRNGIFSTIDKIMTGGQQYVQENMPNVNVGQKNKGITKYKNGEIVGGGETSAQFNVPKIMTPLLATLHQGLTDDKGMFQGGREGRVFGRLKDFIGGFRNEAMNNSKDSMQNTDYGSGETSAGDFPKFDVNNNEEVATMQNMLIQLGYLSGDANAGEGADGMFGKNTESAYRAYVNDQRKLAGNEQYTYNDNQNANMNNNVDYGSGESFATEETLDSFGYSTPVNKNVDAIVQTNDEISNANTDKLQSFDGREGNMGYMEYGSFYEWASPDGTVKRYDWNDPNGPMQFGR